eukprot:604622-Rhodomonas_salina.3
MASTDARLLALEALVQSQQTTIEALTGKGGTIETLSGNAVDVDIAWLVICGTFSTKNGTYWRGCFVENVRSCSKPDVAVAYPQGPWFSSCKQGFRCSRLAPLVRGNTRNCHWRYFPLGSAMHGCIHWCLRTLLVLCLPCRSLFAR